jgi:hypothetical protein
MKLNISLTLQAEWPFEAFPGEVAASLTEALRAHLAGLGAQAIVIASELTVASGQDRG